MRPPALLSDWAGSTPRDHCGPLPASADPSPHLTALACLDGEVIPTVQARISATDDGLLRGDGVFEVMRLYGGRPFARDEHLTRLARSAANLMLDCDLDTVTADIDALLRAAAPGDGLLRVLLTRGGRRVVLLEALPDLGASMTLGLVTYAPSRILDEVKSLSYAANMLASRRARQRGFDEALLITPHGRVLEAPTASFFWVSGGAVLTPPLEDHVLDSITRRRVIEELGAREQVTTRADLDRAQEAFLASTVREVLPVAAIEERRLPVAGPVTERAVGLVGARIAAELSR